MAKTAPREHPEDRRAKFWVQMIGSLTGLIGVIAGALIAYVSTSNASSTQTTIADNQWYRSIRKDHYIELYNSMLTLRSASISIATVTTKQADFDAWSGAFRSYDSLLAKGQLVSSSDVQSQCDWIEYAMMDRLRKSVDSMSAVIKQRSENPEELPRSLTGFANGRGVELITPSLEDQTTYVEKLQDAARGAINLILNRRGVADPKPSEQPAREPKESDEAYVLRLEAQFIHQTQDELSAK
ncbi:hypothetical protein NOVA_29045 [Nocardia nova]|uniref:hypothetical protein n=1 Tax=Nocardia nova TaxID=37330 RepID=UPI001C45285E|nr:hypothetical protein [Nocardia nova]MBV7706840.1 hypothetical protein [Nocardia nova]